MEFLASRITNTARKMGRPPVLCIDEYGQGKFFHAASPKDELKAITSCSVKSGDPMMRVLNNSVPEHVWLSTFTVGSIVNEKTGMELQLAISVIGNPTGNNRSAALERMQSILPVSKINPSFRGPILFKVETPERRSINPAEAFETMSLPEFVEASKNIVRDFECGLQWTYCPRIMKRPL